ncbi:hypothetical protein [Hymenobacter sp.]|uniref:hypothetical protein n=1 Tax=Hymenobacter sp. TaxID=1898978 RepID=UPI00286ADB9C|nr:hypothetical protein [Hymenobacter sp.]
MALPSRQRLAAPLTLMVGCLIAISAGLYNGFPLVTSDSGTYINSALEYTVPADRPIVYGLFIRATGLKFSLWLVIFVQGILLAWLLLRYVAVFAPRVASNFGRLAVVGFTTWLTGLSWYCSQLMPDIFAAIGMLCLGLLLLGRFRSRSEQLGLLALLLLASLVHNSHPLIHTMVVLGFGLVAFRQRLFSRGLVGRGQWLAVTAVVLSSWLVLPAIHAGFGGGFTISRASPAFLMARLCEMGVLDNYLARNCNPETNYKLCAFRDKLPNDAIGFMWDGNSPYNQTGGLEANLTEYRQIISNILTTPRYYPYLVSESVQATLRQLTHVGHGDGLVPFRENTNPYWKVQNFAGYELKEYLSSQQNRGQLSFASLNERTYGAQLLALLVLGSLMMRFWKPNSTGAANSTSLVLYGDDKFVLLLLIVGLYLVANAFVTGALANVLDRLQGRVAWLLPFMAVLAAINEGPTIARSLFRRANVAFRTVPSE